MSWAQQKGGRNGRTSQRIGIVGIARKYGADEREVWSWTREFSFPRPVAPNVWLEADVERWVARAKKPTSRG